jgi:hypothetical protein
MLLFIRFDMGRPNAIPYWCHILTAFTQQWIADIDVIKQHVRRTVEAGIGDTITNVDFARANAGLDPARQKEVFREHLRLRDRAFAKKDALIPAPFLSVSKKLPRCEGEPAVERLSDFLASRMEEV